MVLIPCSPQSPQQVVVAVQQIQQQLPVMVDQVAVGIQIPLGLLELAILRPQAQVRAITVVLHKHPQKPPAAVVGLVLLVQQGVAVRRGRAVLVVLAASAVPQLLTLAVVAQGVTQPVVFLPVQVEREEVEQGNRMLQALPVLLVRGEEEAVAVEMGQTTAELAVQA